MGASMSREADNEWLGELLITVITSCEMLSLTPKVLGGGGKYMRGESTFKCCTPTLPNSSRNPFLTSLHRRAAICSPLTSVVRLILAQARLIGS